MSYINQFLIYEAKDPCHPSFSVKDDSSFFSMDAFQYIRQMETNGFRMPSTRLDITDNGKNVVELQNSTIYYPIDDHTLNYPSYFLRYNFMLCLAPQGKSYLYLTPYQDNQWQWGDSTYGLASASTLLFLFRQIWTPYQTPYEKKWSLDKIIYNPPTYLQQSYLDSNQSHIISLFETYRQVSGSDIIPYTHSPMFMTNYDLRPNQTNQHPYPIPVSSVCL